MQEVSYNDNSTQITTQHKVNQTPMQFTSVLLANIGDWICDDPGRVTV